MLQIFRKSLLFNILLIIPYAFILRLGLYFNSGKSPIYEKAWIYNHLADLFHLNGPYQYLWSAILIILQAFLLNHLVNKFKLNPEGQLFAGVVFILLSAMHPLTANVGPVMLGNVFLILAITQIMGIYIKKQTALHLFNFGFFVGLAAILYPPFIWFLLIGLAGLTILRSINVQEWLQMMSGTITILFLVFTICYVTGSEKIFYQLQIKAYFSSSIFNSVSGAKGLIVLFILLILLIVTLIQYNFYKIKRTVIIQKYYDLMFWITLCSLISLFFMKFDNCSHLILLMTPLSVLLGLLLTKIKNPLLLETLHLLFAFSALFLQIQNW
ncbi:MAG: hypothetical protein IPM48_04125 [Saprospiraceae bacterium]|nr:hypothetical protein [Saprospiraceae bacterium]